MSDVENRNERGGFACKLWRGERSDQRGRVSAD